MKTGAVIAVVVSAALIAGSFTIAVAMIVRASHRDGRAENVTPHGDEKAKVFSSISGEAFLKLTRGNEPLSGMKVSLYDRTMIAEIERHRGGAADARQTARELEARAGTLQECAEFKKVALKWTHWQQKVSLQRDDFNERGYEQIQIFDPITQENILLSWHHSRMESERRLDTIVQKCSLYASEATDQVEKRLGKLGIVNGDVDELLAAEREKCRVAKEMALDFPEVLRQAEASQQPYDVQLTDSDGKFSIESLPLGIFTLVSSYRDPYSHEAYYWVLPLNTTEKAERRIVLSQANAFQIDSPVAVVNSNTNKITKPDVLMPASTSSNN